jgi:hypothetical protein
MNNFKARIKLEAKFIKDSKAIEHKQSEEIKKLELIINQALEGGGLSVEDRALAVSMLRADRIQDKQATDTNPPLFSSAATSLQRKNPTK